MKYYKLTCIKDTPDVEKGFSYTVSEDYLIDDKYHYTIFVNDKDENDKINNLINLYRNGKIGNYIRSEINLNHAVPGLICPKCKRYSLFVYTEPENNKYTGDGVTNFYKEVGLECGLCDYTQKLTDVYTKSTINWS